MLSASYILGKALKIDQNKEWAAEVVQLYSQATAIQGGESISEEASKWKK